MEEASYQRLMVTPYIDPDDGGNEDSKYWFLSQL
jgi:hypothetical protein